MIPASSARRGNISGISLPLTRRRRRRGSSTTRCSTSIPIVSIRARFGVPQTLRRSRLKPNNEPDFVCYGAVEGARKLSVLVTRQPVFVVDASDHRANAFADGGVIFRYIKL